MKFSYRLSRAATLYVALRCIYSYSDRTIVCAFTVKTFTNGIYRAAVARMHLSADVCVWWLWYLFPSVIELCGFCPWPGVRAHWAAVPHQPLSPAGTPFILRAGSFQGHPSPLLSAAAPRPLRSAPGLIRCEFHAAVLPSPTLNQHSGIGRRRPASIFSTGFVRQN